MKTNQPLRSLVALALVGAPLGLSLTGCSSAPMNTFRAASDLFLPRVDIAVGAEPKAVAIADINGDGHLDIVVVRATGSGDITLLSGQGDGTFIKSEANQQVGDTPYAVAVHDFDKDGALDVAVVNYFGSEAAFLYGPDLQTRVAAPTSGSHPYAVAAADFDNNGSFDLVTGTQVGNALNIFLSQGGRSFSAPLSVTLSDTPGGLVAGDLDGDGAGRLDVAVALPDTGVVRVLHGQGGGLLAADKFTDYPVGMAPIDIALGLLDGDTAPDLAVANLSDSTVSVLLSRQGGYATAQSYPVGLQPSTLAIGDIDADGLADVVTSNRSGGSITVLRGQGAGQLLSSGELQVGMQPEGLAIGDLNGDGRGDVVVVNLQSDSVSVFLAKK